jgi:hypothetical protein
VLIYTYQKSKKKSKTKKELAEYQAWLDNLNNQKTNFSRKNMAFGMMTNNGVIYISIVNRHPIDILRTLAHEFVHCKQSIKGSTMKSNPGSPAENQANAKAGEIMRKYGHLHPELFDLMSIR